MDTKRLQEAINDAAASCDKTLDLCGMVAFIDSIQLSSQHDGLTIKNGSIAAMPNAACETICERLMNQAMRYDRSV